MGAGGKEQGQGVRSRGCGQGVRSWGGVTESGGSG